MNKIIQNRSQKLPSTNAAAPHIQRTKIIDIVSANVDVGRSLEEENGAMFAIYSLVHVVSDMKAIQESVVISV